MPPIVNKLKSEFKKKHGYDLGVPASWNQLHDMCIANNVDFDTVISLLKLDNRIGSSHMQVPGPDGLRGFGGSCFSKDTNAFVWYSDRLSTSVSILESAIKYNKRVRK